VVHLGGLTATQHETPSVARRCSKPHLDNTAYYAARQTLDATPIALRLSLELPAAPRSYQTFCRWNTLKSRNLGHNASCPLSSVSAACKELPPLTLSALTLSALTCSSHQAAVPVRLPVLQLAAAASKRKHALLLPETSVSNIRYPAHGRFVLWERNCPNAV